MGRGVWHERVKEGSKALRLGGMKVYQKSLTTNSSVLKLQIYPVETERVCVSHVSASPPLPSLYRVLAAVSSAACQHFHSVMGPRARIRGKTLKIKWTRPNITVQFAIVSEKQSNLRFPSSIWELKRLLHPLHPAKVVTQGCGSEIQPECSTSWTGTGWPSMRCRRAFESTSRLSSGLSRHYLAQTAAYAGPGRTNSWLIM